MLKLARRALHLQPGEEERTSVLFLQNFCVVAITIAGKAARDTFFLSRFDKQYLPLMFLFSALAVAAASAWYARRSRRWTRKGLLDISCGVLAAGLVLLQLRIEGWAIPALYVWTEVLISLVTLQFWLGASAAFDARQAKRLFALIGAGGSLAAVLIGLSLKPVIQQLGLGWVLPAVVVALAGYWILGRRVAGYALARPKTRRRRKPVEESQGQKNYLVSIAVIVALSALVTQVVDYQFKIISSRSFAGEVELMGFFGQFSALTGFCTLVMQFLVTGRLLSRYGVVAGLAALPLLLSGSTFAVLLQPRLVSAILAKFSDQTLKFTLHNSAIELLWIPVAPELQDRAKPVVSGAVKAWSEGLAGLAVYFLSRMFGLQQLGWLTLAAAGVWIVAVVRLREQYTQTLTAAIERRQIDPESIRVNTQDAQMVGVIDHTLRNGEEGAQQFVLDLIDGLPLAPWTQTLRELLAKGTPAVQRRVMALGAHDRHLVTDAEVLAIVERGGATVAEAMQAAGQRGLVEAAQHLEARLNDADPEVRAVAAESLLQMNGGASEAAAKATLGSLLDSGDEAAQKASIARLATHTDLLPAERLRRLLKEGSAGVREATLQVIGVRRERACLPEVVDCLEKPSTGRAARRALRVFDEDQVLGVLEEGLRQVPRQRVRELRILEELGDLSRPQAADLLLAHLDAGDAVRARVCASSLLELARRGALLPKVGKRVPEAVQRLAREAYRANRMVVELPEHERAVLLRDHWEQTMETLLDAILRLGVTRTPDAPVRLCLEILHGQDRTRRPLVLELLDTALSATDRQYTGPLIENDDPKVRDEAARRLFPELGESLFHELRESAVMGREWESAIAIDYLRQVEPSFVPADIDWERIPESDLRWEARSGRPPEGHMYRTLERTILLKSVGLFEGIAAESLAGLAQIAEEVRVASGESLFHDGDAAESLFIVASGTIRIHKDDAELAILRRGESLGEMALLDQAPRSATATAIEESVLLEIEQEDFFEVMAANPEIMRGIVRLLSRRLRDASLRLAAAP